MRHIRVILCLVLLLATYWPEIQSQETISANGITESSGKGTVGYTIGQVAYHANEGVHGSVSEGVQQPYEISIATAIEGVTDINLSAFAFPNPISDQLSLAFNDINTSNLSYGLYDAEGKLLRSKKISSNPEIINMSDLLPAIYYIKVMTENYELKVFKVVKNE